MGIEIAESLISQNHYCPEQRLWRHVLLNAVEDTRILQSDRKSSIHKMEAVQDQAMQINVKLIDRLNSSDKDRERFWRELSDELSFIRGRINGGAK